MPQVRTTLISPCPIESSTLTLFVCDWSRRVIILVKAGAPVDATIKLLMEHMEKGDIIIDGGNEW